MTLKLHRPDGEGGLEPEPGAGPELAQPAALAALGQRRSSRGRLPDAQEPGDEPDVDGRCPSCSGWASAAATFVILVLGYGTGFWGYGAQSSQTRSWLSGSSIGDEMNRTCGASSN